MDATSYETEAEERGVRAMLQFQKLLTHGVGMTVHDHGLWPEDKPLQPGVVIAVDPQLWIPEEKIYIRCEDTVALTADRVENFTDAAPLDPDAIEHTLQTSPRKAIGV